MSRKVSGPTLERFLRQWFATQAGIDPPAAERLTRLGTRTFSSVRVRRSAWRDWRGRRAAHAFGDALAPARATAGTSKVGDEVAPAGWSTVAANVIVAATATPDAPAMAGEAQAAAFDPYAIGLVPTFQREGKAGLDAKLSGFSSADLKAMARAQKIALGDEAKAGDASADIVRAAILAGVEKRIADRRAAAS